MKTLNLQGISIDRLQNFLKVAEVENITKAAKGQKSLQVLYTRNIRELESSLGIKLTEKTGRNIQLTQHGHKLAHKIRAFFFELQELAESPQLEEKILTISSGQSFLQNDFIPHIESHLPQTINRIFLKTASHQEIIQSLRDLKSDLGITDRSLISSSLESRSLGKYEYALFVPKKMIPKKKDNKDQWLESIPWCLPSGSRPQELINQVQEQKKLKFNIRLYTSSYEQTFKALETNRYGVLLPTVRTPQIDFSQIEQIPLKITHSTQEVAIFWNKRILKIKPWLKEVLSKIETIYSGIHTK
jgi:DNA-binding transcriptional LysR family regulator